MFEKKEEEEERDEEGVVDSVNTYTDTMFYTNKVKLCKQLQN